jgi:hypothetical protein
MQVTAEAVVAVGGAVVGFIGWLFRLEGRVSRNAEQIGDVKDDVRYIRERIDRALDGD